MLHHFNNHNNSTGPSNGQMHTLNGIFPGAANRLAIDGFVVVSCLCLYPNARQSLHDDLIQQTVNGPEFRQDMPTRHQPVPDVAMGGFSCPGTATAAHCQATRSLQAAAHVMAAPILGLLAEGLPAHPLGGAAGTYKVAQIPDRAMIRSPGKSAAAEGFHRDISTFAEGDDVIFGGWVNLSNHNQVFICTPGTHQGEHGPRGNGQGFHQLSAEESAYMAAHQRSIQIPPGHLIIFYEHLAHRVASRRAPRDGEVRLFTAWTITRRHVNPIPGIDTFFEDQTHITIKSNQEAPMYADLHWTNWSCKLQRWTRQNLTDAMITRRTFQSGTKAGLTISVPYNPAPSLAELDAKVEPRTEAEISMFYPSREWIIPAPTGGWFTISFDGAGPMVTWDEDGPEDYADFEAEEEEAQIDGAWNLPVPAPADFNMEEDSQDPYQPATPPHATIDLVSDDDDDDDENTSENEDADVDIEGPGSEPEDDDIQVFETINDIFQKQELDDLIENMGLDMDMDMDMALPAPAEEDEGNISDAETLILEDDEN